jgi:type I restriction enzyme S subunit
MPADWTKVRLSELYDFRSGLSKPRSAFGSGFPFLSFRDVFENYFVPAELAQRVESTDTERSSCSIRRGDVFLTRTSETPDELGMSCVALTDYDDATFNGFTKRLRPKSGAPIVPEYAGFLFRNATLRRDITAMATLSTRASLNNEMLTRLEVTLPPVDEQRAIGRCLKAFEDKIELNRRMSETLEQIARAVFRSRFEHPAEVGPLSKIASPSRDVIDPQERPLDQFNLYSIPAFDDGRRPERRTGAEIKSQKFVVRANSVLVSKLNPRIPRVWWPVVGAERTPICSTEFVVLTPANGTSREFLFAVTSDPSFSRELEAGVTGTSGSHQRVRPETVMATEIPIPSAEEMRRFTEIVAPLYARANLARAESETLAAIRDALLPKLISGELRIPPNLAAHSGH